MESSCPPDTITPSHIPTTTSGNNSSSEERRCNPWFFVSDDQSRVQHATEASLWTTASRVLSGVSGQVPTTRTITQMAATAPSQSTSLELTLSVSALRPVPKSTMPRAAITTAWFLKATRFGRYAAVAWISFPDNNLLPSSKLF
ncbi:uncharacterized protein LOC143034687 [Oratosquilla oratoria]|uniref:uncharacterized protein LOC143034687 n=1 Tax=Oratosquilla oratoria TaxID=337810 RepID=UPI003F772651